MSSINYNNNNTNNQIPLRDPNAPPRLVRNISRRGGVLGRNNNYLGRNNNYLGRNNYYIDGNQFYRRNRGNIFNYRRYPPNYYRRNFFYNRNYRIPRQYFIPNDIGGYGFVGQRQQQQLRPIQPVRSSSRRRFNNRPRRRGPRTIRLNDFMPTELREPSPNLPPEFNIATTTTTDVPPDALPQRERFAQRNTTQPFTKINRLTTAIAEACATISELQIQLSTYWMQTISETTNQRLAQTTANIVAKQ
ncbi:unnamed protein product [Rotaria sordida]|uniref:Uncharacterized protein n=1 Tax=Rotaria sordida TaxID=392033 RepID=A0A815SLD6_9BILA|nr:unnamed protein product [Rotaria sordida]CAF1493007.1 unnamed protein product [Rotaria sordida]CAF1639445.1 unnamed protein product [Rotaria sordida]CAF4049721.1 unnamed protein product [Rotaria sordida]